jgi:hypothetical protein
MGLGSVRSLICRCGRFAVSVRFGVGWFGAGPGSCKYPSRCKHLYLSP